MSKLLAVLHMPLLCTDMLSGRTGTSGLLFLHSLLLQSKTASGRPRKVEDWLVNPHWLWRCGRSRPQAHTTEHFKQQPTLQLLVFVFACTRI